MTSHPIHLTQKLGNLSLFSQLTSGARILPYIHMLSLSYAASSMEAPELAKGASETCEGWTVAYLLRSLLLVSLAEIPALAVWDLRCGWLGSGALHWGDAVGMP